MMAAGCSFVPTKTIYASFHSIVTINNFSDDDIASINSKDNDNDADDDDY